jgi:hypothetical protein
MPKHGRAKAAKEDPRRSVSATMERLKGSSRSDLEPDRDREAGSPLGGGTGSDREKLRKTLTLRGRKDAR